MAAAFQAVGAYTNGTQVVSAAADVQIQANITKLRNLFVAQSATGVGGTGTTSPMTSPEFMRIDPSIAQQILAEIDAMAAAIGAAPDA